MENKRFVYHLMSYDNYSKYYQGKEEKIIHTSSIERCIENFSEERKIVEPILEQIRKEKYPAYPSRLESMFVIPENKDVNIYELEWVPIIAPNSSALYGEYQYVLLTLEIIIGEVYWFDSSKYTMVKMTEDIANDYWSNPVEIGNIDNHVSVEGLFKGEARMIKAESKMLSRNKGIKTWDILYSAE